MISASGCATTKPIEYCEPVEVTKDRYVQIPQSLTKPVDDVALSEDFDLPELGAAYKAQRVRIKQANDQLEAISSIGDQED